MRLVFDTESNGFLEQSTKLHSLVIHNLDTGEVFSCVDTNQCPDRVRALAGYKPIQWGLALLEKADELYAHNGIKHDYPLLRKLYPNLTLKAKLYDTLVMARLLAYIQEAKCA